MVLRVYADGVPGPSGESFLVDQLEIYPTLSPQNASIVRASRALNAESYDGVTGLLVPPRDADALAEKISSLLEDPALSARLGRAARANIEKYHSLDAMGEKLLGLYETPSK